MAVLLGGRAAEQLVFGEVTTGAADDLQKASDLARAMVARFGMMERFGPAVFEQQRQSFLGAPGGAPETVSGGMSEATAQAIDAHVQDLVRHALDRAGDLLRERRDVLERTARALLARETLTADELADLAREPARLTG